MDQLKVSMYCTNNMSKKLNRYSAKSQGVWVPTDEEDARKEVPFLIQLFKKYGKVRSILDVGCGCGAHAHFLSKKEYSVEGVEPHPQMAEYARKRYPNIIFRQNNMQGIRYRNEFDALICIHSIIVFNKSNEEALNTFKNFYNSLKKGGVLIIETYNSINWLANNSFRKEFVDIDRKKGEKAMVKEWINTNNQSYVSKRTYYSLKENKNLGSFTKESRMFFPLELKFFLEQAGFKVIKMLSADSLDKMKFSDAILNKRRLLVVAKKIR